MIPERTSAYVLAVVCVFQTLLPSWTMKPHCWRSIDLQMGRLRMQAKNEAYSATWMPVPHNWQKQPKRLRICMNGSGCITVWLDGASHAWMISKDESGKSDPGSLTCCHLFSIDANRDALVDIQLVEPNPGESSKPSVTDVNGVYQDLYPRQVVVAKFFCHSDKDSAQFSGQ
ncbi:hypothetical protein JAO29_21835 [Edaphobacter sp. HDX4]